METVYYDLSARRIKVSGGADLVQLVPAPAEAPVPKESKRQSGQVLDFARCRQQLETKAAFAAMSAAPGKAERPAPLPRARRHEVPAAWLELCVTAVVLAMSVAAAWALSGL